MKGYLEQEGTPTPDKPVEIKTKLIGKNLFETYEVNGKQYIDNIPKDFLIGIPKEQYIEYEQQKEEIKRLNNKINSIFSNFEQFINSYKNDSLDDFFIVLRLSEVIDFYNDLKEVIKSE